MGSNLVDPPERLRCTARANRTGERCRRAAIAGGRVCPTHGGRAPAVKQRAAQRVALQQATDLLGDGVTADPLQVLAAAVRASAALLGAAEAAVKAEEADPSALTALGEAALLAGRLSKLALDSGIEQRLAQGAERHGELVGAIISKVVRGLGLDAATAAKAFTLVRAEVEFGHLDLGEIQAEIAKVTDQLREHDLADAEAGFPERLARAVQAGFAVLDLPEHEQERVVAAVEGYLALERQERAEYLPATPEPPSRAWWTDGPRYNPELRNGGHR